MNEFWQYQFQSVITLTLLFGIYWFLLRKETFFKMHRFFLLAAGIISLVLPLFSFSILMSVKSFSPVQIVNNGYRYIETALVVNPVRITGEQQGDFTMYHFLWGVYLTGVFLLLGRLVYQVIMIAISIRQSETRILRDIPVNVNNRIPAPFSFFGQIFFPFGILKYKHFEEILIHEVEHLKQKHSWDLLFIELLCVFQWFNPFVWFYRRSVKETHEFLADRAVIRQGIPLQNYQNLLLRFSLGQTYMGLVHTFNYSFSKKRMIMMKKRKSPNRRKWRMLFLIPVVVLLNLTFSNPFSGETIFEDQKGTTESYLVKGKMTAEDTGKPLPGVNIIIKGTSVGTVTNINGEFSLDIEEETITLFVAFLGYETLVVEAKQGEFLNIVLKPGKDKKEPGYPEKLAIQLSSIDAGILIVDGKEVEMNELEKIIKKSEDIQQMETYKGEKAVEKYGEKGRNGVIVFKTKSYVSASSSGNLKSPKDIDKPVLINNEILYYVNDKEITEKGFRQISPDEIESVTVLKGDNAVKVYGERARDGVILVTLKEYTTGKINDKFIVKGKVVDDATGKPMQLASIVILKTTIGTVTDMNGEFLLQVDKEKASIAVSYIGYKTKIVEVADDEYLQIRLKRSVYKVNLEPPKKSSAKPVKPDKPDEKNDGETLVIVEDVPHFTGGNQALQEYLISNTHYPKKAKEEGISGTVWVRFTVDESGKVKNVMLDKKLYPLLDKEALRVISSMPDWKPGVQHGKEVPVELTLPVTFILISGKVPAQDVLK